MTQSNRLAERNFAMADQEQFAAASGDRNPMHMDAVAARRTQPGAPVVHGVHLLLWALDSLAQSDPALPPVRRIKVRFGKFVYVGAPVAALLAQRTDTAVRLDILADGLTVAQIAVDFGPPGPAAPAIEADPMPAPTAPDDRVLADLAGLAGQLAFATPPAAVGALFPHAAGWIGPRRVAALAASTLLVGMVCPGLHSIYGGLTVEAREEAAPIDRLDFHVTATDPRFGLVRMAIAGGGLAGTIESFARTPPTPQASMESLAGLVEPDAFAGSVALVVGGSRGLGELAAKLLAKGGARVIVTYRVGRVDADAVAAEISRAGGRCETLPYDAGEAPGPQLAGLAEAPTHAYYFATPTIFRPQAALFSAERLATLLRTYVDGFCALAAALRERRGDISLFYPSSVFVAERPPGMVEYAMAKAAGETLCAEMNVAWAPLHVVVHRLPRLPTDQTASITALEVASPVEALLPAIREVQSWPRKAV